MIRKWLLTLSLIGLLLSLGAWAASYRPVLYTLVGEGADPYLFYLGLEYGTTHVAIWDHLRPGNPAVGRRPRGVLMIGEPTIQYELYQSWLPRGRWTTGLAWVHLPLWIPSALFSLVLWRCYAPIRRDRKRRRLGLCLTCGYDLRGSTERCPECGKPFEKPQSLI